MKFICNECIQWKPCEIDTHSNNADEIPVLCPLCKHDITEACWIEKDDGQEK